MKRIIFLCCLLAHTYSLTEFTSGFVTQDITKNGLSARYTTRFYSDTQSYTNGGLVFSYPTVMDGNYPVAFWITAPRVTVSIQLNFAASPTDTYTAVVTSNTDLSTIVLVYRISDGGSVIEANNGEVTVTLIAIEDVSSLV